MKIALCTPHYADVTAAYARCLSKMLLWTSRANIKFNGASVSPDMEIFMRRSSVLPRCRNALAKDAMDWGANYLLWVDADHSFPEDALVRLLAHNQAVVGVNYPRRAEPTWPTAVDLNGNLVWTTEELAQRSELQEVAHLGMGLCLIDMGVIRTLATSGTPLFALEMLDEGLQVIAEDVIFFRNVRRAGFKVHLDHALSWQVGHQHSRLLFNKDAVPDRKNGS